MTQYYFLIFAFFLSAAYLAFLLLTKKWKTAFTYAAVTVGGVGAGVLLFPASVSQILFEQKGQTSVANAFGGWRDFADRLRQYSGIVSQEFFTTEKGMAVLIILLLALGILFAGKKYRLRVSSGAPRNEQEVRLGIRWWMMTAATAGYFLVVSKISTDIVDRYQFAVYPTGVLAVVVLANAAFAELRIKKAIWVISAFYLLLCFYGYGQGTVHYIYSGYEAARQELAKSYRDTPGIYVTTGDHLVVNDCLFLMQQERTFPLTEEQLGELPEILAAQEEAGELAQRLSVQEKEAGELEQRLSVQQKAAAPQNLAERFGTEARRKEGQQKPQELVVYVNIYFDERETAEKIAALLGYREAALLYDNTYTKIFVLSEND